MVVLQQGYQLVDDHKEEEPKEDKEGACGEGKCTNQSDYTLLSITAAVPEPETYAMLLAGLLAIGAAARRKKSS